MYWIAGQRGDGGGDHGLLRETCPPSVGCGQLGDAVSPHSTPLCAPTTIEPSFCVQPLWRKKAAVSVPTGRQCM